MKWNGYDCRERKRERKKMASKGKLQNWGNIPQRGDSGMGSYFQY